MAAPAAPGFTAGQFTGQLDDNPIGMTKQGFRIASTLHEDIIQTDEGGQAILDSVNAGADVFVTLDWCEYTKVVAAIGGQITDDGQFMDKIGTLKNADAMELVLTPVAGLGNTKLFRGYKALIVTNLEYMINRGLRQGPLTMRLSPDFSLSGADAGRHYKWEDVA